MVGEWYESVPSLPPDLEARVFHDVVSEELPRELRRSREETEKFRILLQTLLVAEGENFHPSFEGIATGGSDFAELLGMVLADESHDTIISRV